MSAKLKLDLDALQVESFDTTSPEAATRGTVVGMSDLGTCGGIYTIQGPGCCGSNPLGGHTCTDPSCANQHTCDGGFTCQGCETYTCPTHDDASNCACPTNGVTCYYEGCYP